MTSTATAERVTSEPPAVKPKRARKPLLIRGGIALAALVALGYGYHWWTDARFVQSTDDAYVGGDVTLIAAKVPGYITEVAVTDNQQVHAGDVHWRRQRGPWRPSRHCSPIWTRARICS